MSFREHEAIEVHGWDSASAPETSTFSASSTPCGTGAPRAAGHDTQAKPLLDHIWPHVPTLRKYLQRRLPSDDVDDALQDILVRIIRRSSGAAVQHPKCYLYQVAHACLIDRRRRETSRRQTRHCELSEDVHPVDDLSPLRILLAREEMQATEAVLGQLPERTRAILLAMRLEGSSLKSLAERYNISTSAVEKHITRAIKALSAIRRCERGPPRFSIGQISPGMPL